MNLVERFVVSEAGAALTQRWRPAGSIVLTPRYPDSRHVVVLLLDRAGRPRLVGKVVRAPADPSTLDREAAVLTAVGTDRPAEGARSVPRLLALEWVQGHRLLLQTAVEGTTLTHATARRRPEHWWHLVDRWLTTLPRQPADAVPPSWLEHYLGADVTLARNTLAGAGALTGALEHTFDRTVEAVERLQSAAPFVVVEHGDLSHPNLMVGPAGVGAVDWETGDPVGLPGVDAATFLAFLEFSRARVHGTTGEVGIYRRTLLSHDGSGRRHLSRHLDDVGVGTARIDDVLATTWAKAALSAFGRLLTGPDRHSAAARRRATDRFLTGRPFALWNATLTRGNT